MNKPSLIAGIIVAAGAGERCGGDLPKQYRLLKGKPLVWYSVQAMLAHPAIQQVVLVIQPSHRAMWQPLVAERKNVIIVEGRASRQGSVLAGLEALALENPAYVLIHDAARPLLTERLLTTLISQVKKGQAVIPGKRVADTLKRTDATGLIIETLSRDHVWQVGTPQAFPFEPLWQAHRKFADQVVTDDAALCELAGFPVSVLAWAEPNPKITYPEDLAFVETLICRPVPRIGSGFDVHAFAATGDHVTLCGIKIPHHAGLVGHSDADVALHAVTDALLGAIAAGDIGQHFPPSDPQWRGADSAQFVKHACKLVSDKGFTIGNVDLTIIGEAPKIGPWREKLQQNLAIMLGIAVDQVGIKATTTEKLGFTGRQEGLAAQAVALVY